VVLLVTQQEFRELEILDEITTLSTITTYLIVSQVKDEMLSFVKFQEWKGVDYVPKNVHTSIRWSKQDPMDKLSVTTDTPGRYEKCEN